MRFVKVFLLPLVLMLGGCDWSELAERVIPDEARPVLEAVETSIVEKDTAAMAVHYNPQLDQAEMQAGMEQLYASFPEAPPESLSRIGASINHLTTTSEGRSSTLSVTALVEWPDETYVMRTTLRREGDGAWQVYHLNFQRPDLQDHTPAPISELSFTQKVFGVLLFAIPIFCLITFFATFRFKRLKRRILWPIFVLLGFPVFAMNWTTGEWWLDSPAVRATENAVNFNLFSFKLLGAGFLRQGYFAPWIVSVAVPIGALLFWYRVMRGGPTRKNDEQRLR